MRDEVKPDDDRRHERHEPEVGRRKETREHNAAEQPESGGKTISNDDVRRAFQRTLFKVLVVTGGLFRSCDSLIDLFTLDGDDL